MVNFDFDNIDAHPLRYSRLVNTIEIILSQRECIRASSDNGYVPGTLPTAVRIAEAVVERLRAKLPELVQGALDHKPDFF